MVRGAGSEGFHIRRGDRDQKEFESRWSISFDSIGFACVRPLGPGRNRRQARRDFLLVDYITYILIVLGVLAYCYVWLRRSAPPIEQEFEFRAAKLRKAESAKAAEPLPLKLEAEEAVIRRTSLDVPVPWGWPGHHEHANHSGRYRMNGAQVQVVSDPLHRFVDRMLAEKQTVQDREYILKKDASIRALIEDRYGKIATATGGSGKAGGTTMTRDPDEQLQFEPIKELKTPWGW